MLLVEPEDASGGGLDVLTRQATEQAEVELLLRTSLLRNAGLPSSTLVELLSPINFSSVTVAGAPVSEAALAANFIVPYVFTLIFVLSIFITSGYLLQSVTEEKENRVVEILLSSIPALPLMAGKVLGLGAAGLTQVAIWLVTAVLALPILNQQLDIHIALAPATLVTGGRRLLPGLPGLRRHLRGTRRTGHRRPRGAAVLELLRLLRRRAARTHATLPERPQLDHRLDPSVGASDGAGGTARGAHQPPPPWLMVTASLAVQVVFVGIAIVAAGRIFRATVLLYGTRPNLLRIIAAVTARA